MSKELLCAIMLIIFFGVMVYVGFYSRKHAKDVNGFVLGGRGVGPWLTAFALEHHTFQQLSLWDMRDSLAGTLVSHLPGRDLVMRLSVRCLRGMFWEEEQEL